jgi:signal transduction histidine kinase
MGFMLCDLTAEIVVSNQAVKRMLTSSLSETERLEQPTTLSIELVDRLFGSEFGLKQSILDSLARNQPLEGKEVNVGQRVLLLSIAPIGNEPGVNGGNQPIGAVLLIEDITEQKILERSKDEFLSIASHELRTPLTAIRGNASLLTQYYAQNLPKDTLVMINDIHESAIRLIEIVNDFLDASSLEQGKMQLSPTSFAIVDVVDNVIRELYSLAAPKGLKLSRDENLETLPPVWADKQRIKQVIYNLMGNAIKFTDQGGIEVRAHVDDAFVYLTVKDSGRGMSSENQRLLFRKFQQAGKSLLSRDATKGTGLGLYISKLITEQSGGSISLKSSTVGIGSIFEFSVPIAKAQ